MNNSVSHTPGLRRMRRPLLNLPLGSLAIFSALILILVACGDDPDATPVPQASTATSALANLPATATPQPATATPEAQPTTIVDIAVADGRFETLVTVLGAAGLAETLQGEGPFTVFAPTDDAFAKLPAGTVESLLADIPALTDILLYHVVPSAVMATDVTILDSADTVQVNSVAISVDGSTVRINDAQVVIADIEASNGVIHVVDSVLIPANQ